jgi:hypothetical protein
MPITPFHFGLGAVVKVAAPRHVSFTVFAFSQLLIDLEPVGFFLLTGDPVHPYLHTFLGAAGVFLVSWWPGRRVCEWALRAWNAWLSPAQARWLAYEPRISGLAAAVGAFIGAYSHVAVDSIMHTDVHPFAPLSDARPWLGAVSVESLQGVCLLSGGVALSILFLIRWRELRHGAGGRLRKL